MMEDFYIIDVADELFFTRPYCHGWVFGSSVVSFEEYIHGIYVGKSCALGLACKVAYNLMVRNFVSNCAPCHICISCTRHPTDVYVHEMLKLSHLVQFGMGTVSFRVAKNLQSELILPNELKAIPFEEITEV